MDVRLLEGIAREAWESTGGILPVDAEALANACDYEVRWWAKGDGARSGRVIWAPLKSRPTRQHGRIAHELGHGLLEEHGCDPCDEEAARYLAGALLLPRTPFLSDVRESDYDLWELERRHPNASAEMIICRMTQVSPAVASVWDGGRLHRSYGGGPEDAEIVDRVLALEQPINDGAVRAWPVLDGVYRRVLVVRRAA